MRPLSASELLNVWEQGLTYHSVQKALMLLAAACPETTLNQLAQMSIGERDACLLKLREWTFGSQLRSLAVCPNCSDRLELSFNVADIQVASEADNSRALSVQVADYQVQFRPLNSLDLLMLIEQTDIATSREILLTRCLLAVHSHGETVIHEQLPNDVMDVVAAQMAKADPQADVQLALTCPQCGHQWQAVFDIVSFFWNEINAWADRILREVHTLASAYGWREVDILAMSPGRRQLYMEMISK